MFRRFHSAVAVASANVLAQRNIVTFPALTTESAKKVPAPIPQPAMSTRVGRMAQLYFSLSDTERENLRRAVMFLGQRRASEVVRSAFLKMRVAAARKNQLAIPKTASQVPFKASAKKSPTTVAKGSSVTPKKSTQESNANRRGSPRSHSAASKADASSPSTTAPTPIPAAQVLSAGSIAPSNKAKVGSTTPVATPSAVVPKVPEAVLRQILQSAPKRTSQPRAKPTVSRPSSATASPAAKPPTAQPTKMPTAAAANLPPGLLDSLF